MTIFAVLCRLTITKTMVIISITIMPAHIKISQPAAACDERTSAFTNSESSSSRSSAKN